MIQMYAKSQKKGYCYYVQSSPQVYICIPLFISFSDLRCMTISGAN